MLYIRDEGHFIYEVNSHKAVVVFYGENGFYFWESREEKDKIRDILGDRIIIEDEI